MNPDYQTDMDPILECATGREDTNGTCGVTHLPWLRSGNARTTLSSDQNVAEKNSLPIGEFLRNQMRHRMMSCRDKSVAIDLIERNRTQ